MSLPTDRTTALSLAANRASKIKLLREGGHWDIAERFAASLADDIDMNRHAPMLRIAVGSVLRSSTLPGPSPDSTRELEVWEGEGGYVPAESPLEPSGALPDFHGGYHFIGGRR